MNRYSLIVSALLLSPIALRADLVLEQKSGDTNQVEVTILKVHGDKMREDQPGEHFGVVVDLKTRDAVTLFTNIKKYLKYSGEEARRRIEAERKSGGATNELDFAPAAAVDTGKAEVLDTYPAEIYKWQGANGTTMKLWVATNYPNFDAIKPELVKLDEFNDSGAHRNAQPQLGRLPGMVLKTETVAKGRTSTATLVRVKVDPVDPRWFDLPADYVPYQAPTGEKP